MLRKDVGPDANQPNIAERIAYLFYVKMNAAIAQIDDVTNRPFAFFHSHLTALRSSKATLAGKLVVYKDTMLHEENARRQYAVPRRLDRANTKAQAALSAAKTNLLHVQAHEQAIRHQQRETELALAQGVESLEAELKKSTDALPALQAKIAAYQAQLQATQNSYARADRVATRTILGCIPAASQGDMNEAARLHAVVLGIDNEISLLNEDVKRNASLKAKVVGVRGRLTALRQRINAHIGECTQEVDEAKAKIKEMQIATEVTAQDIVRNETRYYASVSEGQLMQIVDLYAAYLQLKINIDSLYTEKRVKATVANAMSEAKDRLDEYMAILWCPEQSNKTAETIYQAQQEGVVNDNKDIVCITGKMK